MNTIPFPRSRSNLLKFIGLTMLIVLLLACSLGGALQGASVQEESGPVGVEETVAPGGAREEGEPPEDPPVPPTVEEEKESEEEGEEDPTDEIVTCPTEVSSWELIVDHHFWTDAGMGLWEWEASGGLVLFIDGPEIVGGPVEDVIPGRQYGAFADGESQCTFEAPAEVQVAVHGSCQNGVVTLNISENWQMGTYTWVCQTGDETETIMFDLPDFGSAIHPDLQFLLLPEDVPDVPYVEIVWGGGDGIKSWKLGPSMEPVPLAP